MSLLPLLLSTWWAADLHRPYYSTDVVLTGLRPEERAVLRPFDLPFYNRAALYPWPWLDLLRHGDTSGMSIVSDKNNFQIVVDVRQFKPEEINVKVVDRCVMIEAKHEERRDEQGSISRQFVRRYRLPDRADIDQVTSTLSSDRVLTVTAPLTKEPDEPNERTIKIELTGQPAPRPEDENRTGTSEAEETSTTATKAIEENEIREEVTTQGDQNRVKPEK